MGDGPTLVCAGALRASRGDGERRHDRLVVCESRRAPGGSCGGRSSGLRADEATGSARRLRTVTETVQRASVEDLRLSGVGSCLEC